MSAGKTFKSNFINAMDALNGRTCIYGIYSPALVYIGVSNSMPYVRAHSVFGIFRTNFGLQIHNK